MTRPFIRIVLSGVGSEFTVEEFFLVDSGADRTVFRAGLLAQLRFQDAPDVKREKLQGLMAIAESLVAPTTLILKTQEGHNVRIKGDFTALTDPAAIDTSILGRDVLSNFDLIMSRRRNEILLIAGAHQYEVTSV